MTDVTSWNKAIDKKVKTSDDKDLGKKIGALALLFATAQVEGEVN